MRRTLLLAVFALTSCDNAPAPAAQPASSASAATPAAKPGGATTPSPEAVDAVRDAARKIEGLALVSGQAMKTLTELTDANGPRLTGSDVHKRAAAWAADRFRSYGVDAALETFSIDHGWVRGEATARVVGPAGHALHVTSFGWTPGTSGVLRLPLVLADFGRDASPTDKDAVKGKLAFFGPKETEKVKHGHPGFKAALAGAAAMLFEADRAGNTFHAQTAEGQPLGTAYPAPYFMVGHEDGEMLRRLLEKGPVTLEVSSTAQVTGPEDVPNVVAEIKGREKPGEVVMVGAHLDCWDYANGAQDNGSGSAQVIEVARVLRAMGTAPRRTVRFALWAGEEEGLWGSRAYVKAHASELDTIVSYVNTDYGAGAPIGWDLDGRDDVSQAMTKPVKDLLAGIGAETLETKMRCDTDHCPFWLQGVPTFNLDVDTAHYGEIHHLSTDTVDKVKEASLSQGAAAVAVLTYVLAELPDRVAPRLSHATVAKHIKDEGADLLPDIVDQGIWKP
jgi:carboxypeptidase Q